MQSAIGIAQSVNFHRRRKLTRLALISGGMLIGRGLKITLSRTCKVDESNFTYVESVIYPPSRCVTPSRVSGIFALEAGNREKPRLTLFFLPSFFLLSFLFFLFFAAPLALGCGNEYTEKAYAHSRLITPRARA
ncbi:hypothetical protein P5V15_008702 [Pogonomyrmex californicus]